MMFLGLILLAQVVTGPGYYFQWFQDAAIITNEKVELYLVCIDGQPTSACARVLASSGVGTTVKTFEHPVPPLLGGQHVASVQACTANAAECSSGLLIKFEVKISMSNPVNGSVIRK
jgi:hypothetical protein